MNEVKGTPLFGVSHRDITPPIGVTLAGYTPRFSTSVGHPLRAECLACGDGTSSWAIVTSDVIGYSLGFTEELRRRVARATDLSPSALLLSATHTHSGPSTILVPECHLNPLDAAYRDSLLDALTSAVTDAYRSVRPGKLEGAFAHGAPLASNRRAQASDGAWVNEWEDPEGRHRGYCDDTITMIRAQGSDGHVAMLANFGCHPVTLGPSSHAISADYVGYCKDSLERIGTADTALFTLSGAADINPRVCIREDEVYPRLMGETLAHLMTGVLDTFVPIKNGVVSSRILPWVITRTRDAYKPVGNPGERTGDTIVTELQLLVAGDLAILAVPGELWSEYAGRVRQASAYRWTIVVSLANDYVGYLPTDAAQREGAYEPLMAPAYPLEASLMESVAAILRGGE